DVGGPGERLDGVDVLVGGGDVEVARHHRRVRLAGLDEVAQGREPLELVGVVRVVGVTAVGHVDRGDPQAVTGGGDGAGLLVGVAGGAGQALHDVVEPHPGQQCHAVPAALPVVGDGVTAL